MLFENFMFFMEKTMKKSLRLFFVMLMTALVLGLSGCASMIYTTNYDSYVTSQLKTYKYSASEFPQVWTTARQLLFKQGFQVRDSGDGYSVETEWADTGSAWRRYLLTGYKTASGEAWVEFLYYEESYQHHGVNPTSKSERDYQMEAEVLKIVKPAEWSRISNEADAYATAKAASK